MSLFAIFQSDQADQYSSLISILDAGNEGSIKTFIICEALTYGSAPGPFPALGVGYKILTGNAISLGYVPYVGDGSAVLSTVSASYDPSFWLIELCPLTASLYTPDPR